MTKKFASHYLYSQNLPRQLEAEVLDTLVTRLCNGDKSVAQDIATGHIRMVLNIARKFGSKDDYVSVGLEGLMEAINNYANARASHQGEQKGITAYIAGCVRYKILTFMREDSTIRVPNSSQHRKDIKAPKNEDNEVETGNYKKRQSQRPDALTAVNEILKLIAANDLEKIIIRLRRRNFNDNEIAIKLDLSVTLIHSIRKNLEKKFKELWS